MFYSCEQNSINQTLNNSITIKLSYSIKNYNNTKSCEVKDKFISNINIFIYNINGNLINSCFYDGFVSTINLKDFFDSEGCYIYVLANVGRIETSSIPSTLDDLKLYKYKITDEIRSLATSMPMCYNSELLHVKNNSSINICLTRLMSSIVIKIDKSQLSADITEFNIKKISLHNIPKYISPFSEYQPTNIDDILYKGDSINITENKENTEFQLFTAENLQGDLLPNNTEENYKSFEITDIHRKLCTYIEINATYKSKIKIDNNLIYRIYPGENETSNFDVKRNTNYYTIIQPIDSGTENLDNFNWKIDLSDMIYYVSKINLSPKNITIDELDNITLHTNISPKFAEDTLITFNSSDNKIASVDNYGNVSAIKHGECDIIAEACNGITEKCHLIVNRLNPAFQIDWGKDTIYRTEIRTAKITKLFPLSDTISWTIKSSDTKYNFINAPCALSCISHNKYVYTFYSMLIFSNVDVTLSCKIENSYLPNGSETLSHVYHYQQLNNTIDSKYNEILNIYRGEKINIPVNLYPNNIGQDIYVDNCIDTDSTSNIITTINPDDTSDIFILGKDFVTKNNNYVNNNIQLYSGVTHDINNIFIRARVENGGDLFTLGERNDVTIKVIEPTISTNSLIRETMFVGDTIDIPYSKIKFYPASASQIGLEIRNNTEYVKIVNNKLVGLKNTHGESIAIPLYFKDHNIIFDNKNYNFHYPKIPNIKDTNSYNCIVMYLEVDLKKRDS